MTGVSCYRCRKTLTSLRYYLLHRRMMVGSPNQTLYHVVTVNQGLARLENSFLHLWGIEQIHSLLKISRPCWTRLTTLVMNFLCLSLLLRLHRNPKHLPLWRPTTNRSKAIIYLYLNCKEVKIVMKDSLIVSRSLPLTIVPVDQWSPYGRFGAPLSTRVPDHLDILQRLT